MIILLSLALVPMGSPFRYARIRPIHRLRATPFGNYTTQINTGDGRYMLADGSWKWLTEMTGDELSAAHMPAGN